MAVAVSEALFALASELLCAPPPPPQVVADRTFDSICCLLVGARTGEGAGITRFRTRLAGTPQRSALSAGVLDDLASHVSLTRLTELDDIHMASCTTVGSVVVPTALALAAGTGTPERYASAVAVGYEAMTRLGRAIDGARIVYTGVWPSYVCAPFAAAAAAAQLLGLDTECMTEALALALIMASGAAGGHHSHKPGRWLTIGQAARSGCIAALAAADGYTAELAAAGPLAMDVDPDVLTATPVRPAIEEISVKPFAAAKQAVAATEAAVALRERFDPGQIRRLQLRLPEQFVAMVSQKPGPSRASRLASVAWNIALGLCHPEGLDDPERRLDPDEHLSRIRDLLEIEADPALSAAYPSRWPARMLVEAGAERYEHLVTESSGDPGPDQRAVLRDKWDRLLGREASRWHRACAEAVADPAALSSLYADVNLATQPEEIRR